MVCTPILSSLSVEDSVAAFERRAMSRIRASLDAALDAPTRGAPPRLASAMRYAVLPGGGFARPLATLAVAASCGEDDPALTDAAAAAVELLHAASLVHDDMPCFDDAATRRGRPSVHAAFGEPTALLTGDALIVLAFETIAHAAAHAPARGMRITRIVAGAVGAPRGIIAGQACELEEETALDAYHSAKTGALFEGAIQAGAAAAGADPESWRGIGMRIGRAYQIADDIADATSDAETLGKPVGQDEAHGRPNAVRTWGVAGAKREGRRLLDEGAAIVPLCPGRDVFCGMLVGFAARLRLR
jgi:geranylgeranyl diphosphate synthase type II